MSYSFNVRMNLKLEHVPVHKQNTCQFINNVKIFPKPPVFQIISQKAANRFRGDDAGNHDICSSKQHNWFNKIPGLKT